MVPTSATSVARSARGQSGRTGGGLIKCVGDCGRATRHLLSGVRAGGTLGPRPEGDLREELPDSLYLEGQLDELRTLIAEQADVA